MQQRSSSDDTTNCHVDGIFANNEMVLDPSMNQLSEPLVVDAIIANNEMVLDPSLNQLPEPLVDALIRFTSSTIAAGESPKLLPIQQKSYEVISKGGDAVLFSPTGTGKSLGFILPLAARLWEWKRDGSLLYKKQAQKQRYMRQNRGNGNDSISSQTAVDAATPSILVVEPSRELARQVGKVWEKFHPTAAKGSKRHVVTVYGGVPMTRHAALLGSKTDVVVGSESSEIYVPCEHPLEFTLFSSQSLLILPSRVFRAYNHDESNAVLFM